MSHNLQVINFDPPKVQTEGPGGTTSNLQLWLKADAGVENTTGVSATNGQTVLNWLDNTINTNDATQSVDLNKPIYTEAAINFNPTLDFDGTNHEITTNTDANNQITIFAVTEGTYGGSTKSLINLDNGANGSVAIEQTATSTLSGRYNDGTVDSGVANTTISETPFIVHYRHEAGETNSILYNGLAQDSATPNANNLSGTLTAGIGATPSISSTRWDGGIAEILVYNQNITSETKRKVESYLAIKYGITLGVNGSSQSYKDSDGRQIWNIVANAGYNYNVAGIGKDNVSELEQKQSKTCLLYTSPSPRDRG